MSSSTEAMHTPVDDADLHAHPTPRKYVTIAVILAIVTAAEVAIYYVPALTSWLVPLLIVFAVIKFIMVAGYFMHLKFDSPVFKRFFLIGVVLAFLVFAVVLATFFFGPEGATTETGGVTG